MKIYMLLLSLVIIGFDQAGSVKNQCNYALRKDKGFIKSPQYPNSYANNLNCSWQIVVPIGKQIVLNSEQFKLENSYNCESDALYIYDGPNERSKLYSKPYCHKNGPKNVTSSGNSLFIRFITDKLDNARGFLLKYDSVKVCDYEFTQTNGTFASPRYPNNYYENANCSYRIRTRRKQTIVLRFLDFVLERKVKDECLDYVKVYDVLSTGTKILKTLCGDALPLPIQSSSNKMLIKFHSDGLINNIGFKVSYHSVYSFCRINEFKCGNGRCVHVRLICNGVNNCLDNTDEAYCCKGFTCDNHKCIDEKKVCNGVHDCHDGSDEKICNGKKVTTLRPQVTTTIYTPKTTTKSIVTTPAMNCGYSEYECQNKECIAAAKRCDGENDCGDNSDESDCSGQCKNMNGGCQHICSYERRTGVKCSCYKGFQLDSDGVRCIDINECSSRPCAQLCTNIFGSYKCGCPQGYRLASDQYNCTDFDECALKKGQCEQLCINKIGTYECACYDGFIYDGEQQTCVDVDECLMNNGGCSEKCVNEIGTYSCACNKTGYKMIPGKTICEEIDECELGTASCDQYCVNTDGGYKCRCRPGFRLSYNEHNCEDVNECLVGVQGCYGECINTVGSYRCKCDNGFKEINNDTQCEDVDECQIKNGGCSNVCVNNPGSFLCKCHKGYIARDSRSFTCVDKNECENNPCEEECINTPGSFQCRCKEGYHIVNFTKCLDVDECIDVGRSGCEHHCTNTPGSFFCACPDGLTLNSDKRTCIEAVNSTGCRRLRINTTTILDTAWTDVTQGWVWQVSLSIDFSTLIIPNFKCMGVLVDKQFVLTTAHCVKIGYFRIGAEKILVSLGGYRHGDRYSNSNVRAKKIIFHGTLDLALIQLMSKIKVSKHIQPICLMQREHDIDTSQNQKMVASTWSTGMSSSHLQQIYATVVDSNVCKWNDVNIFRNANSICARFDVKKTFLPMSGSPLLAVLRGTSPLRRKQKWYLAAILIQGDGFPGKRKTYSPIYKHVGYYRASQFVNWIRHTIKTVDGS